MAEWKRVLKKSGNLFVAVPNLDRLCELFLDKSLPFKDRMQIMRIIYGGHTNEHNYHYVGFDKDLLLSVFANAGFKKVWQVKEFGFFDDSSLGNWQVSDKIYSGLSINFIAEKE
jgi:predicted SAM-dependent methyltransferase